MHIMETLYNISPILKYNRIENNSNENVFIVFIYVDCSSILSNFTGFSQIYLNI